jgi:hypothetical protein
MHPPLNPLPCIQAHQRRFLGIQWTAADATVRKVLAPLTPAGVALSSAEAPDSTCALHQHTCSLYANARINSQLDDSCVVGIDGYYSRAANSWAW